MQPLLTRFDRYLPTDVRHVTETAEVLSIREVEVFRLAYRWWHKSELSEKNLDKEFSAYLLKETVPPWVRHFCRKIHRGCLAISDIGCNCPKTAHFPDPFR